MFYPRASNFTRVLPTEVPGKEWFYWGTDHNPGALGLHETSPKGGTLGEQNRCFIDWYG